MPPQFSNPRSCLWLHNSTHLSSQPAVVRAAFLRGSVQFVDPRSWTNANARGGSPWRPNMTLMWCERNDKFLPTETKLTSYRLGRTGHRPWKWAEPCRPAVFMTTNAIGSPVAAISRRRCPSRLNNIAKTRDWAVRAVRECWGISPHSYYHTHDVMGLINDSSGPPFLSVRLQLSVSRDFIGSSQNCPDSVHFSYRIYDNLYFTRNGSIKVEIELIITK